MHIVECKYVEKHGKIMFTMIVINHKIHIFFSIVIAMDLNNKLFQGLINNNDLNTYYRLYSCQCLLCLLKL